METAQAIQTGQYGETVNRPSSDCVVVIPTYNERDNIGPLITALKALEVPLDILVVDDNSPDGTADIVRDLMKHGNSLYLLSRPYKEGLGSAYKAGFAFALRHGWRYMCQMDADFSHRPADIPRLLATCRNGTDVAIGSRYVGGGRIRGWSRWRWLLSRAANCLGQVMLNSRIADLTGGFKCFTRQALQQINLDSITGRGYIFQVEMNHRACRQNLRVGQLPICFTDRRQGQSKLGKSEAWEGLVQLIRLARQGG